MHPRHYSLLALWLILLCACGRSDDKTLGASTSIQLTHGPIADMFRKPPAPGQSIEIDTYHWVGWRRGDVHYALDEQGCPAHFELTYLTDQPVPEAIDFPFFSKTNLGTSYPADEDAWLIPMPASIALKAAASARTADTGKISPSALPEPSLVASVDLPYHGRLRGYVGDPAFGKCAHNDRIFVVEAVTAVYEVPPLHDSSIDEPAGYRSWPEYHDSAFGFSFAYAPDWSVEALKETESLAAVAVHTVTAPDLPIVIRVHAGETQSDPYDVSSIPPLVERRSHSDTFGDFNQRGILVGGVSSGQNLFGLWADRPAGSNMRTVSGLISAHGYTYEIAMTYPVGLRANQPLIDAYAYILDRFHLDAPQEPSPTAVIKQVVGSGPFLSKDEAVAALQKQLSVPFEVVEARLVSEAEVRGLVDECGPFLSHPDGIWLFRIRGGGDMLGRPRLVTLDATTGKGLCAQPMTVGTPLPSETIGPAYPQPTMASP